ncbi:MAG: 5'-3' exonuclease H3TH domain-containing protein [Pseudohongiellaceae bacterium]
MPAYLIDASIYIFQAHFSPYVECQDGDGEDISALFGFAQFLLQFLRRENPLTVAVAMDESLFCGFRHQLCDKYKSNRELPDENLARQLAGCTELSKIFGLRTYGSRRYEADDIIGTLTRRLRESPGNDGFVIVSRDKDLSQLLAGPNEIVWDYQGNRRRGREDIFAELGIYPQQIPDYLGLVGDAVDAITGVPGIGPVKGRVLLQHFDDMDGIYRNINGVGKLPVRGAAKLAALLTAHRDQAYLARQLATIVIDVDEPTELFSVDPLESLRRQPPGLEALQDFLSRQKFPQIERDRVLSLARQLAQQLVQQLVQQAPGV